MNETQQRLRAQRRQSSIAANSTGNSMGLLRHREENFDQAMRSFQDRRSRFYRRMFTGSLILLAFSFTSCSNAAIGTNSNSTAGAGANPNGNNNAGSQAVSTQPATIDFKEPERYSMAMTISAQAVADAPSAMETQQFGFAKMGSDRRWSFALPAPLGHIVYLEKSGLKYLVFIDRNQYVELARDALGFEPTGVLTPSAIAEQLKPRSQYEQLGLEPVNGRTSMKYRVTGGDAARKTNGVIFVDQETGLPLRYELNAVATPGPNLRVIVEARDVQLNPDRLQFEVPAGMKKVTSQVVKSQVETFAASLRSFSDIVSGKSTTSSAANAIRSNNNKNAGPHKR
jgi:outer membrane lipoprotein-sorting protein